MECTFCDRTFCTRQGLIAHTEAKHGRHRTHVMMKEWENGRHQSNAITTSDGGGHYSYSIEQSMYDGYRREWVCSMCDRGFRKKAGLRSHLDSGVHESSRYYCQGCSRGFTTLSGLEAHTRSTTCSAISDRLIHACVQDAQYNQNCLMLTDGSVDTPFEAVLFFDGGCRGNPSDEGGSGFVLKDARDNCVIDRGSITVSDTRDYRVTNNLCEYIGLFEGIRFAYHKCEIRRLMVYGDSELAIKQMNGQYRVKNPMLRKLYHAVKSIAGKFLSIEFKHVYRCENSEADQEANDAMDQLASYGEHWSTSSYSDEREFDGIKTACRTYE